MTPNEFPFVYNLSIRDLDSLIDKFAIILKTKINETNAASTNKDSGGRKIKTFFNTFYEIFPDFNEKKTKRILAKDIPDKEIIEFLKAIVVFFPDINVLGKGLNAEAD